MSKRPGLKAFGLCALVAGLMAISDVAVAQASSWIWRNPSNGQEGTFNSSLEAQLEFAIEENDMLASIEGTNLGILCTGAAFIEGGQLAGGSVLLGRLEFSGCVITVNGTPNSECQTEDPVGGLGRLRTEKVKGSSGGGSTIVLSPDTGTILKRYFFEESCPVAEEIVVQGELVLKESQEEGEILKQVHLFEEFPGSQGMSVGVHKLISNSSATVRLTGEHTGYEFAGIP